MRATARPCRLPSRQARRTLALSLAAGLLGLAAGCGGGGSGPSADPAASAADFPVADTFQRLWSASSTWQVRYTPPTPAGAPPFEVTVSYMPGPDTSFEGSMRKTVTQLATYRVNNVITGLDATTLYYSTGGGLQIWGSSVLAGPYTVMDAGTTTLPSRRAPGLQGVLGSSRVFADSSKAALEATGRHSWAVERVDDLTARICLNTTQTDTAPPGAESTESSCWRVGANGEVMGLRLTVTTGGQTVTFE